MDWEQPAATASGRKLESVLVTEAPDLEPHRQAWDRLAELRSLPYCAPAWMLSWWRHAAPDGAQLRTVLVFDGGELVGVGPFYALPRRWPLVEHLMLAASACGGVEPLAASGLEAECATCFCQALAASTPPPSALRLESVPHGSEWPALLRDLWPARLRRTLLNGGAVRAPAIVRGNSDFDEYFAARSSNFRSQLRRHRRQLQKEGMAERLATAGTEVQRDLQSFAALHYERWRTKGGSDALRPGIERMLESAAAELVERGRLRVFVLEVNGETASVQVFVAAGETVSYWLGGFDERWGNRKPGYLGVLSAIEDFFARGQETKLDLGPGAQPYKYRFADGEETLDQLVLPTRLSHLPLVLGAHLVARLRGGILESLDEQTLARLRGLRRPAGG